MGVTVAVTGWRDVIRGLAVADRQTKRDVRQTLRRAGEFVRTDAAVRVAGKNVRTAVGYKVRIRQSGIAVEQSIRKTTGKHPEWGAWQMRHALIPARSAHIDDTTRALEHALQQVCVRFNEGGITSTVLE